MKYRLYKELAWTELENMALLQRHFIYKWV